jgi:ATP-dependent DNA helicase RecQ
MGIDKSNVRFVIHFNLPRNLEGYYQEIGRAGRDGLPAEALLFFSYQDVTTYRQMIEEGEGSAESKELKIAKLHRMFQFAEAPVCRRKTVLNYFNEPYDRTCGNCDVCRNPPRQFDGTTAAQKALSAVLRVKESIGMTMLVQILRGSQNRELLEQGYQHIKTYGAGKEYSYEEWIFLLAQMMHVGLLELAYDDHSHLRVTDAGRAVLFENKRVSLALPPEKTAATKAKEKATPAQRAKPLGQARREELFSRLVVLRRQLAQTQGVPPYLIFSDATLEEMAEKRPLTDADLLRVSSVGERKLHLYGDAFLGEIRRFVLDKTEDSGHTPGTNQLMTWQLFQQGQTVEQIADTRQLSPITVVSHLASMYERGELVDLNAWVSPEELDIIQGALPLFEEPYVLQDIYEHFKQRHSYDKIRWAIADYKRQKTARSR